ncbi:unnamed protein product [Haemonchus placei]|uniref:MRG domain-containing protein n=1 Tax=Haemonchus placei TaxID=6290 RepID=A0A0N4W5L3_HAEPC|nr:unnamed protein product [Haemonchus placei]
MPPKHAITYELHDKVLCKYKDYYYAGKIVNVSTKDNERMFTVHYQGWHKRHDAVVPESKVKQLFLPYTDENVARTTFLLYILPFSPESIQYYGCLPKSLNEILEKDHDAVIHRRLLTKLPAAYPVDLLLVEFLNTYDIEIAWGVNMVTVSYGDEISCSHLNCLLQSCQMITDYFNMMLGKLLLYPPERDQYQSELLRQRLLNLNDANGSNGQPHLGSAILPDNTVPVRHSSVFGLPHLLRLFKCLAEKFSNLPQDSEPLVTLKVMTAEFVMFLEENRDKYFSVRRDYEPQE